MSNTELRFHWLIKLPDLPAADTNEFTLDDGETFEKATGDSWMSIDPRTAKHAAAVALVLALKSGKDVDDAEAYVESLTYGKLRGAFTLEALSVPASASRGEPLPPSSAPTSPTG